MAWVHIARELSDLVILNDVNGPWGKWVTPGKGPGRQLANNPLFQWCLPPARLMTWSNCYSIKAHTDIFTVIYGTEGVCIVGAYLGAAPGPGIPRKQARMSVRILAH